MPSVFYRHSGMTYPLAVKSKGMLIYDAQGREYLDMSGGAAVSTLGHAHPAVINAVQAQTEKLAFAHTAFFTNEPQEELAERLAARFPETGARAWFTSGGSESNETALKIAWQYWRAHGKLDKTIIISRQFSYHGGTLGATSVSGSRFRRAAYEQVLHDWPRIAPCYAYRHRRDDETEVDYAQRAALELEDAILSVGAESVAAFIAEPVVGATLGCVPATPGYFEAIRRICDKHEVLFIADEVMCGSGRTGSFYAFEQESVLPDIVTLAKGLGGGYQPLGAVVTRQHVCDGIYLDSDAFAHGHTYIGHPTACAAGVAVQKCLDDGLLASVAAKGEHLQQMLADRFGEYFAVGDVRGRGLFVGLEFVADKESKEPFPREKNIPALLKKESMQQGLICYPGGGTVDGWSGAHLLLAPPFIAEAEHFNTLCEKLARVFAAVFTE